MQIGNLIRSLFVAKPVAEQVEQTAASKEVQATQSEDCFEDSDLLPIRTAELVLPETHKYLEQLKKRALATSRIAGGQQALVASLNARAFQKQFDQIQSRFDEGDSPSRAELVTLRRQMWECSKELDAIQRNHLALSFQSCTRPILAKLEVLALLQAITDGDTAYVKARLPRFKDQRYPQIEPSELLHKFDSHLLKIFADHGLVESMTFDERSEIENNLEELPELEQKYAEANKKCEMLEEQILGNPAADNQDLRLLKQVVGSAANQVALQIEDLKASSKKLNRQYYLRDHFYVARPNCVQLIEGLVHLIREAYVGIASRQRLTKHIIESLYRGHFEMFCSFGVIERLPRQELDQAIAKGFAEHSEFVRMGNSYCRISNTGIHKLKETIALTKPFVPTPLSIPKAPNIVKQEPESEKDFEEESTKALTQFPRYAIIPLDEAIVFY